MKTGNVVGSTAIVILLALPALAQGSRTNDRDGQIERLSPQIEQFAPPGEEVTTRQIVESFEEDILLDDFDGDIPEEDDFGTDTGTAPMAEMSPMPETTTQAEVAATEPAPVEPVVPDGWNVHEFRGATFAVPPDFEIHELDDDEFMVGRLNMAEKKGIIAGGRLEDMDGFDEIIEEPGIEVVDQGSRTMASGEVMDRWVVEGNMPDMGDLPTRVVFYVSQDPVEKDEHLILSIGAVNMSGEDVDAILAGIDASLDYQAPEDPATISVGEASAGLSGNWQDGLLHYTLPDGWSVRVEDKTQLGIMSQGTNRAGGYAVSLVVRTGGDAERHLLAVPQVDDPGGPDVVAVGGVGARLYQGRDLRPDGSGSWVMDGGKMVPPQMWLFVLDQCLSDGSPITVTLSVGPSWLKENDPEALVAGLSFSIPPAAGKCSPTMDGRANGSSHSPAATDRSDNPAKGTANPPLALGGDDWKRYTNPRFGTQVEYPSSLFSPLPPPENGDGQRFEARDGRSGFMVYAGHNALNETIEDRIQQRVTDLGEATLVQLKTSIDQFYIRSRGKGKITIHAVSFDPAADVFHVLEIVFPTRTPAEQRKVYGRMLRSFLGSGEATELAGFNGNEVAKPAKENGRGHRKQVDVAMLHKPEVKTPERAAIMKTVRKAISTDLKQPVVFRQSAFWTDGSWAYFQGTPRRPKTSGGGKIDWSITPFASDMQADAMSDVVMVLLYNSDNNWRIVEQMIGPTDVAWINWAEKHELSEALFVGP